MEYGIWDVYMITVCFGGSGINIRKYNTTYLLSG